MNLEHRIFNIELIEHRIRRSRPWTRRSGYRHPILDVKCSTLDVQRSSEALSLVQHALGDPGVAADAAVTEEWPNPASVFQRFEIAISNQDVLGIDG